MAVRRISTRFAIEGESEYQAKMKTINSEIKVMASNLKFADSELKTNGASIQTLTAKGAALDESYKTQAKAIQTFKEALENAKSSVDGYSKRNDELSESLKKNESSLESMDSKTREAGEKWAKYSQQVETSQKKLDLLKKSSDDTSEEQEKLQKSIDNANKAMEKLEVSTNGTAKTAGQLVLENKNLNQELSTNTAAYQAAQEGVNKWQVKLNNASTDLNKLDAEIAENNRNLDAFQDGTQAAGDGAEDMGDGTKKAAESVSELNTVLASAGLIALLKQVAGIFVDCAQASIAYESAIAGVAKTTDLTDTELAAMRESLQNLSTEIPVTANELANITESAGQLGIAKQNLIAFTETMANLATATNMTSDAAATTLARFANITGMDQTNFDRLGSSIVALGNSFATTESEIADMALRLAGAGAQIKLSEGDILGIAAALSSLGIESQAGGSAFSRVMTEIQVAVETNSKGLKDFAAVADMSAQDFSKAFKEDAAGAITQFIIGLGNAEDKGTSVTLMLEELGIKELRMADALKRSANASELFARALETSNTAWEENTALTKEAETRYATTESKLQMMANAATNLQTAIGDELTPAIGLFADAGTSALNFLSDFVTENEEVVPLATMAATAIGMFAAGVVIYNAAVNLAIPATKTFTAAMTGNPVGLLLVGLAGAAALIAGFAASVENDATPSVKELTEATRNFKESISESESSYKNTESAINGAVAAAEPYIAHLKNIEGESIAAGRASEEYTAAVDRILALLPGVNVELDIQTGLLTEGAEALESQIISWKEVALNQALATKNEAQMKAWADATIKAAEASAELGVAQEKGRALSDEREKADSRLQEIRKQHKKILDDETLSFQEQSDATHDLVIEKRNLEDKIKDLDEEIITNKRTQEGYTLELEKHEAAMLDVEDGIRKITEETNDYAEQQEKSTEATEKNTEAQEEAARTIDDYAKAWGASVDEIAEYMAKNNVGLEEWEAAQQEATEKVAKKWGWSAEEIQASLATNEISLEEWESAAEDMISRQDEMLSSYTEAATGMFSRISDESKLSLQDMIDNLTYNQNAVAQWADNITYLASLGIDDGLLKTLIDAGPESAAAVQRIVDGGSEKIGELSSKFESGGRAAMEAYGKVLEVDPDNNAALKFLQGNAAQIEGDTSVPDAVKGKGEETKQALEENVNEETGTEAAGKMMDGAKETVDTKAPELKTSVDTAGKAVETSLKTSATQSVIGFSSEFAKIIGRTNTTLSNLRSTVTNGTSSLPGVMYGVGAGAVNGMINGMYGRSGALNSAIASIVNGAIASAKKAAQVNSPSRKTMPIGDGMVEGVIVSAEAKKEKLKRTMQGVIDTSVKLDTTDAVRTLQNINLAAPVVSGVSSGTVAPNSAVNVNVTIREFNNNTPQDGEALIQQISTGMYQELRRKQMGGGQR